VSLKKCLYSALVQQPQLGVSCRRANFLPVGSSPPSGRVLKVLCKFISKIKRTPGSFVPIIENLKLQSENVYVYLDGECINNLYNNNFFQLKSTWLTVLVL